MDGRLTPRPLVVGANHHSSTMATRDRLFVEDGQVGAFLGRVRDLGVAQALVLSTCDRVEVQAADGNPESAAGKIVTAMAEHSGVGEAALESELYVLTDEAAVRHIFSVAASLDSLVIGEPQVLGQVKACHRMAREAGMSGGDLEAVVQAAFGAAKRVRSETAIGEGPVSMASASVQIARDLHGDLEPCGALLLGGGEMAQMMAVELRRAGLGHLVATHRMAVRGEVMARSLECHCAAYGDLAALLAEADIVLAGEGGRSHSLGVDMIRQALRARRRKPMFIVDAALPGDVEPAVSRLDGVFTYDLADLERVAVDARAGRQAAAEAARRIVAEAEAAFYRGRAERHAVPALARLRSRFEDERRRALEEAAGDADKATRLLVGRLLHSPSEVMRGAAAEAGNSADWDAMERVLTRLFRLEEANDGDDER